jgi:hypothetical protein
MLDELPPQIIVGDYQHVLNVLQNEREHFVLLTLRSKATVHEESHSFAPGEEADILPWLAEAGAKLGEKMDHEQKRRLQRAGYRV